MIHLRGRARWAWCGAILAVLGCSHDYNTLGPGSAGTSGGRAGSPGAGGTGVAGQPGAAGAVGAGGAGAVGGLGAVGGTGAVGAVGGGGAVGLGGQTGTGGAAGASVGTGGVGVAGQTGKGGATGTGGQLGTGGSTCTSTSLNFVARAPSVLILTDRGGSSFDPPPTGTTVPRPGASSTSGPRSRTRSPCSRASIGLASVSSWVITPRAPVS